MFQPQTRETVRSVDQCATEIDSSPFTITSPPFASPYRLVFGHHLRLPLISFPLHFTIPVKFIKWRWHGRLHHSNQVLLALNENIKLVLRLAFFFFKSAARSCYTLNTGWQTFINVQEHWTPVKAAFTQAACTLKNTETHYPYQPPAGGLGPLNHSWSEQSSWMSNHYTRGLRRHRSSSYWSLSTLNNISKDSCLF